MLHREPRRVHMVEMMGGRLEFPLRARHTDSACRETGALPYRRVSRARRLGPRCGANQSLLYLRVDKYLCPPKPEQNDVSRSCLPARDCPATEGSENQDRPSSSAAAAALPWHHWYVCGYATSGGGGSGEVVRVVCVAVVTRSVCGGEGG